MTRLRSRAIFFYCTFFSFPPFFTQRGFFSSNFFVVADVCLLSSVKSDEMTNAASRYGGFCSKFFCLYFALPCLVLGFGPLPQGFRTESPAHQVSPDSFQASKLIPLNRPPMPLSASPPFFIPDFFGAARVMMVLHARPKGALLPRLCSNEEVWGLSPRFF